MKLKRIIGMLVLMIITILTVGITNVQAANNSYILGITNVREAQNGKRGGAYEIHANGLVKKVWKMVSYPTLQSPTIDYSNAFYCLRAEHGFMTDGTNVSAVRKTYNTRFDMKTQKSNVMEKLNSINVFKTDPTSYNKIMWIADNMYLPKSSGALAYKEDLLRKAGIVTNAIPLEHVRITDDDIEVVQQLAIWYFTNYDIPVIVEIDGVERAIYNYRNEQLPTLYFNNWSGTDGNYQNFEDLYNNQTTGTREGLYRQQECNMLYKYFLDNAKTKGNYVSPDVKAPITLDKSRAEIIERDEDYLAGPFKINQNSTIAYTVNKLGFTDQNGQALTYTLLNENKVQIGSIQYGKDFYISIPLTTKATSIKFNMGITYSSTTVNYYTTEGSSYLQEQPAMLVERKPINYTDSITLDIPAPKAFDLSLRKFISSINGIKPQVSREPIVNLENLQNKTANTATYNHTKTPIEVKKGDIITYTIRVYNEGAKDGYVSQITDHLPPELEFLPDDEQNIANGWVYDENDTSLRTIRTNHLSKANDTENLIKAFNGTKLEYKDITIKCRVKSTAEFAKRIVNIAQITGFTDKNGNTVTDRDSQASNVNLPTDEQLPHYEEVKINRGDKYIPGQQDDDDFDNIIIKEEYFDLALRKFITKVNNETITNRIPQLKLSQTGNIISYNHTKEPIGVKNGDIITYTLRIYNEGMIDGYAKEITDNLPEGLLYLPENETNKLYRWEMIDKNGNKTQDITKAVKVTTDYLSKEQEKVSGENLIKAFDKTAPITNTNPDYRDIKIAFKVTEPNTSDKILINIAEISDDSDKNGDPIEDIDSIPGNGKEGEDDIDIEKVKLVYFDLALRKFITKVDNLDINNRYPALSIGEDGNIKYTHTKEPVLVANGNIVTYTLRIYNEGKMDGYAKEITDDLPQGLQYLPDNELNKQYRWEMIDKDGNKTQDVTKAVKVTTDYLSKQQEKQVGENLIKAFNQKQGITQNNPDYKDVKIAFKVTEPNTSDRILINTAEISDDSDKNDKPVEDIDSVPGNGKEGEDDIDIEKVKVKYFDLALKKWVIQAIVIENGKQTITNTNHTGDENPEPVVKVDLKAKDLNKVTVKFKYSIKVTNEGQIEGYVKELKDYIPEGLKFIAQDNPKWKQISDKIVTTDQLKDHLLKPGESASVDIILTWENSEKNLGLKVNWAEISEDYNEYEDTPDIDSTPDNFKQGEDDIDNAPVILSVKTGEAKIYFGLSIIVLTTLAGGVYLIKKYVL